MALHNDLSECACIEPHNVYLELVSRKDLWFAKKSESEEEVARDRIDFHLVLNSFSHGHAVGDGSLHLQPRWATFRVKCCSYDPSSPRPSSPTSPSGSTTSLPNITMAFPNGQQQPAPKPQKFRWTGRGVLPDSILTSRRPHPDSLHPPLSGSTTSLPTYMSGGPVGPISSVPSLERSTKPPKKVGFASTESYSVTTLAKTNISSFASLEPTNLVNICQITLGNKGKKQASPSDKEYCHGFIMGKAQGDARKFALYAPREKIDSNPNHREQSLAEPFEHRVTLTLRQILDEAHRDRYRVPEAVYGDRIRMAVAISASVLHMDTTPWLSKPLTLDDIVFLVDKSSTRTQKFQLRPFISKPTAVHHDDGDNRTAPPISPYPTTFYLGLLLCQLLLHEGRTPSIEPGIDLKAHLHDLAPNPSGVAVVPTSIHKLLAENARKLFDELQTSVSDEGMNVVKWCIEKSRSEKGLGHADFRADFYTNVVEALRNRFKGEVHDL